MEDILTDFEQKEWNYYDWFFNIYSWALVACFYIILLRVAYFGFDGSIITHFLN